MKLGKHWYSLAVDYAGLVGKYIRMERPSNVEELAAHPDQATQGMECLVHSVEDTENGKGVIIYSDYGYAFDIYPEKEEWSFQIWPSETVRKQYR